MTLRQIAYLSTRPDILGETLGYVRHFMPWLEDVVVVTPRRMVAAFTAMDSGLTVVADEDLLAGDLGAMDHQTRNFGLRAGLCRAGIVDDVFLCSDDDYRPMKAITPDRFVLEGPDGRDQLIGYTFYDLLDWSYDRSEFDRGQHNTLQLLAYLGAEQKAYASHMPQAIDRALLIEAAGVAARLAPFAPVDEWAIHFNLGRQLDPGRFAPARPYLTLGWPQYPNEWRRTIVPSEYAFENFYPEMYEPRHLYAGLPTALDPARVEQDAVEKLLRWRRLDMAVRRLEMPDDLVVPWTGNSRLRRAYFAGLRPARKTLDYLLLGERAATDDL
jgi:hypothetical protein